MSNPIIDYELGKMTHREYETRACGCRIRKALKIRGRAKNHRKAVDHKSSKK